MTTSFREPAPPREEAEPIEVDNTRTEEDVEDFKPFENENDVLKVLGVEDDIKVLPPEDQEDLQELKDYLGSYIKDKGLPRTLKGMQKALKAIKEEAGLDEEADPQAVIKRIGGVARSYKELSFIRDVEERKKILVKLLGARTRKEMDSIVFDEMNRREIWLQ